MVNDTESSVLATFEFLNNQSDNGIIEGLEVDVEDAIDHDSGSLENDESEDVLNEFDLVLNNRMDMNERDLPNWNQSGKIELYACLHFD